LKSPKSISACTFTITTPQPIFKKKKILNKNLQKIVLISLFSQKETEKKDQMDAICVGREEELGGVKGKPAKENWGEAVCYPFKKSKSKKTVKFFMKFTEMKEISSKRKKIILFYSFSCSFFLMLYGLQS